MDARAAALALCVLLPAVHAEAPLPLEAPDLDAGSDRCAGPPCGYILPILDIQIEDKMQCGGGRLIYADGPPDDCYPILAPGATWSIDATMKWYWELSEDGTYPKDAGEDIEITFGGASSNQGWLTASFDGPNMVDGKFLVTDADMADPNNLRREETEQGVRVWFEIVEPMTVTFTRTGDPGAGDLRLLDAREGVLSHFVKGKSSENGAYFREAFGMEDFRFNTCTDEAIAERLGPCGAAPASNKGAPMPLAWAVLGLALVAACRRRA